MVAFQQKHQGFTIVELLIVVVIIAILAAISIVVSIGITDRANASAAASAASQAAKKVSLYYAENESYPTSLTEAGLTDVGNLQYSYSNSSNPKMFCLTATVANKSFYTNNTTSSAATEGGCAGHGQGGVEALTNYALDPNAAGPNTSAFGYAGVSPVSAISTISSDRSHSGSTSLRRQINAAGQTGAQAKVPSNTLQANIGEKISWSFWIYSTKAGTIHPWADATRVDGGAYAGGSAAIVNVPAGAWTKVTGTFAASSNMYITQIGGYDLSVTAGDIVWFDEFMVTKTDSVQNFADGNSSNWLWNGTPNNSTSTGPAL